MGKLSSLLIIIKSTLGLDRASGEPPWDWEEEGLE